MSTFLPWIDDVTSISQRLGPGLSQGIADYPLPPLHHVRQKFPRPLVEDIDAAVAEQFARPEIRATVKPGARVCVCVGSRGINRIAEIVRAVVREVKAAGGAPFIIPTMGSHGGATSEGQLAVLADYNINEATMGCPVISNIAVNEIGKTANGMPVYCSVDASGADAIIPIGRIKPHTGFRGPIESGLVKMMTIGLGKQKGADTLHAYGMASFGTLLPEAAQIIMDTQPIAFGLGIVENGYDQAALIEAVLPTNLIERETELLAYARSLMPSLPFKVIDLLVLQYIGKNISGSGMDPNVCGRFVRSNGPAYQDTQEVQYVAVLDLTPETHGNASGLGLGDLTTLRVLQKLDLKSTYVNCMTASHLLGAFIPPVLENDLACLKTGLKTATNVTPETAKVVIAHNTLEVGEIWISPALYDEAVANPNLEVSPNAYAMEFDADGNIISPIACKDK